MLDPASGQVLVEDGAGLLGKDGVDPVRRKLPVRCPGVL